MSVNSYLKNQLCHQNIDHAIKLYDIFNNVKMTWFQQLMSIYQNCLVIGKYTNRFAKE